MVNAEDLGAVRRRHWFAHLVSVKAREELLIMYLMVALCFIGSSGMRASSEH